MSATDHLQLGDDRGLVRRVIDRLLNRFRRPIITGRLVIEKNGVVVLDVTNTITTAGRNAYADQILASPTLGKPTHMAVGTGSPAANALGAEVASSRVALTSKTRSGNVVTMIGDWAAGVGTGALTEAGIFDASSSGNMNQSTTFSVINKAASDTLKITWTLTVG